MAAERPCFRGDNLVREVGGWRCRVCETLWPSGAVQWTDDEEEGDGREGAREEGDDADLRPPASVTRGGRRRLGEGEPEDGRT